VLIETKLRPPQLREDLVARPRLLRQLDGALSARLTVLTAPAGFGKSTVLGQWIALLKERGAGVAWLACDRDDDEIGRFLAYLVAALNRADPAVGRDLPVLLQSSPVLPIDSVLTQIVNDLAARGEPLFLVFDDAQFLRSADVCGFLDALLTYAPPSLHVVVATRDQPPFALAHMRVRGQLLTLDDTQLRFSLEETETLLNEARVLDLPTADVVALQHRTEGWVAGLQLASLSLEQRAGREDVLRHFSGGQRDVAAFLAADVLERQPEEVRRFLLETAILGRISAPLADAVTGRGDGARMLQAIESANLFLIALDGERHWFRYHHLFAEFLLSRLQQGAAAQVPALHRRAADWLSANGHTSEAVSHALAAGDADRAAALVEDCAMPLIMASHLNTVRAWLGRLPEALIARRPRLLLAQVWIAFHMSRPQQAVKALKAAKQAIAAAVAAGTLEPATQVRLRAELRTLTAGVISAADRSRSARRLSQGWLSEIPDDLPFFKGTLGNIHAFCCLSLGDLEAARLAALQARDRHAVANSVFGIVYSDLILGLADKAAGNLQGASQYFARAIRHAREQLGAGSYAEAMVAVFNVELLYEWNDIAAAERLLHQHRQIIEECGLVVHEMACKLHLARLAAARGRDDEAMAVLERAERLGIEKRYHRLTAGALNERVRLLLRRGDAAAARYALKARGIVAGAKIEGAAITPTTEPEHLAQARVMIAEGNPAAAQRLLEQVSVAMRRDGRGRRLAQARALAAIAAHQSGDALAALAAAVETISICAPQRALRCLIDEGADLRQVLEFARGRLPNWSADTPTGTFVEALMTAWGRAERQLEGVARGETARGEAGLPRRRGDPEFSNRESALLRLLSEGKSNRELAAALDMAPDTVKWHLKNIFGKLGVANRTQAVLRLQEIGLAARPKRAPLSRQLS
jgi:LuxR family maltose regulon positive regulatory protein